MLYALSRVRSPGEEDDKESAPQSRDNGVRIMLEDYYYALGLFWKSSIDYSTDQKSGQKPVIEPRSVQWDLGENAAPGRALRVHPGHFKHIGHRPFLNSNMNPRE